MVQNHAVRDLAAKGCSSDLPAEKDGAYRKAGANGGQQDEIALTQLTFFDSRFHGQRDGPGRSIAVLFDINDHTIGARPGAPRWP